MSAVLVARIKFAFKFNPGMKRQGSRVLMAAIGKNYSSPLRIFEIIPKLENAATKTGKASAI